MSSLLTLTEQLCAVPSVSGDERVLADLVESMCRENAPKLDCTRVAHNVVVRSSFGRSERVVLGGHLDTVPPNGNAQPRRDGELLHGLGTADMKGGLAVLLELATAVSEHGAERDVTFVFYEGEEVADEHNGLRHLFAQRRDLVEGDLAILLEPTGGWVEAGCQGTIHVRATFHGARAHSARPWMGSNAIHRLSPLLARLAGFEAHTVDVDGLAYREALQVVRVEGGIANNVVPDRAALVVNRRYAPNRDLDTAVAEVVDLCAGADDIEVLNASVAAAPHLSSPLVAEFVSGGGLAVRPKLGWTDVARFSHEGIPACNFGPGDPELAHTADERVAAGDLEICAAVLAGFLGAPSAGR